VQAAVCPHHRLHNTLSNEILRQHTMRHRGKHMALRVCCVAVTAQPLCPTNPGTSSSHSSNPCRWQARRPWCLERGCQAEYARAVVCCSPYWARMHGRSTAEHISREPACSLRSQWQPLLQSEQQGHVHVRSRGQMQLPLTSVPVHHLHLCIRAVLCCIPTRNA